MRRVEHGDGAETGERAGTKSENANAGMSERRVGERAPSRAGRSFGAQ